VAVRAEEAILARPARLTLPAWLLAVPATAALLLLFVAPFGIFTVYSFLEGSLYQVTAEFTVKNFQEALSSSLARRLTVNALVVGVVTSLVCLVLGLPLAYFIRYRAGRLEYPLLFLVVLGMFASYLVRIYAWRTVLGERGLLNQTLDTLGLPGVGSLLFTRVAVTLALIHIFVPYVVLVAYAAMRNLPHDLIDLAAFALVRAPSRFRGPLAVLFFAPITLPGLFLGLALLTLFARLELQLSLYTVAAAHFVYTFPYFLLIARVALDRLDPQLDELGADLGATTVQRFRKITFPLVWPILAAAGVLAFALSFDEFIITFFVIGPQSTVPLVVWSSMRRTVDPSINALATLLLLVTILGTVVTVFLLAARRYARKAVLAS
jgi:ABC-type spermidine/putrescine transport system permease subunit II